MVKVQSNNIKGNHKSFCMFITLRNNTFLLCLRLVMLITLAHTETSPQRVAHVSDREHKGLPLSDTYQIHCHLRFSF